MSATRNNRVRSKQRATASARAAAIMVARRRAARGRDGLDLLRRALVRVNTRAPAVARASAGLYDAIRRTKLIDDRLEACAVTGCGRSYRYGLARLVEHHADWIRDPSDWRPRTHNAARQFRSLTRHLLTEYTPPPCLEVAWFGPNTFIGRLHRKWYVLAGGGTSLRCLPGVPCALTRRAAHALHTVPADLELPVAFRWAQLRGIGADDRLIEQLVASRMGTDFARDAFWLTLASFFVRHPLLDRALVRPIVDYVHHVRHETPPPMIVGGRRVDPGPLQPGFSMKGRTPESLIRVVDEWHRALGRVGPSDPTVRWTSCGVPGLDHIEGKGAGRRVFAIREILDARSLRLEGRAMGHCVGTYVGSCRTGRTAIYTLTVDAEGELRRAATIEMLPQYRMIVQARGRFNSLPGPQTIRILDTWARQASLKLADCL